MLRFGRYEVLFRIAAGGMAEVYAAKMVGEGGFEKPVALKRMLPTLAEDERFVQMFLDEGRLAAHISSPHVVQTLDLGRADDDSLYLVMELVVGVSLSALIRAVLKKKTPVPVAIAVDILAQAASGLHDAHEARTMYGQPLEIVHRDVSPQNILVDVSGRVRITDFGVARALERATHTQSGEVKGKIGYFAPEQVRGKEIDRRTDVYALGIVAWETLAGKRLFAGDNPAQTLDMVMTMAIPRLDVIRPEVPRAVADAVERALERDPDRRIASAGLFAEELRHALKPAGSAAVGALVRENGGESLMKLEEGLRAQSPSALSKVRRSGDAVSLATGPSFPSLRAGSRPTPPPEPIPIEIETMAAIPALAPVSLVGEPPARAQPTSTIALAIGAVALLLAIGVGGAYALWSGREPPEVRTIALPLPQAPAATVPVPAAAPTELPAASPEPQIEPTPPATAPAPVAARPPAPRAPARPSPTPLAEVRTHADPPTPPLETPTSMEREPDEREPRAAPPTTSMAATTMTGLAGVSDFERELGIE